ncbi:uncharacterized protein ISCGN_018213 [Ixodes scapularis]
MMHLCQSVLLNVIFAVYLSLTPEAKACSPPPDYDTWKFIQNFTKGYIKYKNYDDNRLCVGLRQIFAHNEQYALYNSSFRTSPDTDIQSELLLAKVEGCSNVLSIYNNNAPAIYNATLLYSNGIYCAIFKSMLVFPEPHCAVWVNSIAGGDDIDDCIDHFTDACVAKEKDVYPSDICGQTP